jgi:hypothetical protein
MALIYPPEQVQVEDQATPGTILPDVNLKTSGQVPRPLCDGMAPFTKITPMSPREIEILRGTKHPEHTISSML